MSEQSNGHFNVLFLCTGNSARSIMAEVLLNTWGKGRFTAYSAGSQPNGTVNPFAIQLLESFKFETKGLRSKSWNEFSQPDAPKLDFVFTVCGSAAKEVCPIFPGQPMSAHWGVDDPAAAEGTDFEKMTAFREAFRQLENRIKIFCALRTESLDRVKLQKTLDDIGTTR